MHITMCKYNSADTCRSFTRRRLLCISSGIFRSIKNCTRKKRMLRYWRLNRSCFTVDQHPKFCTWSPLNILELKRNQERWYYTYTVHTYMHGHKNKSANMIYIFNMPNSPSSILIYTNLHFSLTLTVAIMMHLYFVFA